jgi:Flp pilus assembly protein TadD
MATTLLIPVLLGALALSGTVRSDLDPLIAKGQHARVEQVIQKRLADGEAAAPLYFQVGKLYFDREQWQRSVACLERSLALERVNAEAHRLLGLAYRELHRPDAAETELLEAARLNPSDLVNAYFAGHQLILDGKFEAALPYLYRSLESKPLASQALEAMAMAQARLGNYGLAEAYYRKAIASPPAPGENHYAALLNLSVLLLLGHDPARLEEGLTHARQAMEAQPDSPDARFLAGKALFKLGRLPDAAAELSRAAKLSPEDSRPHFLLARIYAELGDHDRAQKERKLFQQLQARPGQAGMATAAPLAIMP